MKAPDESVRCESCKSVIPFPDATEADTEKAWGRVWRLGPDRSTSFREVMLCKRCHPQGRYHCDWCGERFQGTVHEWVDWVFVGDFSQYWNGISKSELAAWLDANVGTARPYYGVLIEKKPSGRTEIGLPFGLCTLCDPGMDPERKRERRRQLNRIAQQRQRDRQQQKPKPTKVCPACGETFMPKRSDAVCCSERCKKRHQRQGES